MYLYGRMRLLKLPTVTGTRIRAPIHPRSTHLSVQLSKPVHVVLARVCVSRLCINLCTHPCACTGRAWPAASPRGRGAAAAGWRWWRGRSWPGGVKREMRVHNHTRPAVTMTVQCDGLLVLMPWLLTRMHQTLEQKKTQGHRTGRVVIAVTPLRLAPVEALLRVPCIRNRTNAIAPLLLPQPHTQPIPSSRHP